VSDGLPTARVTYRNVETNPAARLGPAEVLLWHPPVAGDVVAIAERPGAEPTFWQVDSRLHLWHVRGADVFEILVRKTARPEGWEPSR
jgi:hypothetical protein